MDVLLEENGKVRNSKTLELVGDWFIVDGVKYIVPLKKQY